MSTETVTREELIEYKVSKLKDHYRRLSVGILKVTMYLTFIGIFVNQYDPTTITMDYLMAFASAGAVIGSTIAVYGLSRVQRWSRALTEVND